MEIKCNNCCVLFERTHSGRKFCSNSCSASFSNRNNPKRTRTKVCKNCTSLILSSRTYCSDSCFRNFTKIRNATKIEILSLNCSSCKRHLEVNEFYRTGKKKGISSYCKDCVLIKTVERQVKIKSQCLQYKGNRCQDCGHIGLDCDFDFHHLDPKEKDFNLSQFKSRSFERLKSELDKCVILCSICHRRRHKLWNEEKMENLKIKIKFPK